MKCKLFFTYSYHKHTWKKVVSCSFNSLVKQKCVKGNLRRVLNKPCEIIGDIRDRLIISILILTIKPCTFCFWKKSLDEKISKYASGDLGQR